MRIIVNAVTNMVQEIICKWEKLRMRSQYGARDNLQMRDNWKCGHKYGAEDNLQVRKIANAVPRTAVRGRYRGKRNSIPTKTYKRHPLTIMTGMSMIKRTERAV